MKNEEKAQEICEKNKRFKVECSSLECYLSAMDMAKWKDKQLKEACSNCEDNLIKMGKRCPWRSMSNDYCWEK